MTNNTAQQISGSRKNRQFSCALHSQDFNSDTDSEIEKQLIAELNKPDVDSLGLDLDVKE